MTIPSFQTTGPPLARSLFQFNFKIKRNHFSSSDNTHSSPPNYLYKRTWMNSVTPYSSATPPAPQWTVPYTSEETWSVSEHSAQNYSLSAGFSQRKLSSSIQTRHTECSHVCVSSLWFWRQLESLVFGSSAHSNPGTWLRSVWRLCPRWYGRTKPLSGESRWSMSCRKPQWTPLYRGNSIWATLLSYESCFAIWGLICWKSYKSALKFDFLIER